MTNTYNISVLNRSGSGSSGSTQEYTISYPDGASTGTKTFKVDVNDSKLKTFDLAATQVPFEIKVNPGGNPHAAFTLGVNGAGRTANVTSQENGTFAVAIV
ncbi:hypothetical protein CaCOL14_004165 [Colletotrichum acutatum]